MAAALVRHTLWEMIQFLLPPPVPTPRGGRPAAPALEEAREANLSTVRSGGFVAGGRRKMWYGERCFRCLLLTVADPTQPSDGVGAGKTNE